LKNVIAGSWWPGFVIPSLVGSMIKIAKVQAAPGEKQDTISKVKEF
jgi:hypothetical protein